MKNKLVHFNIFLRYLISHILLFSVPVLVLGFISYNLFVESLKSEVIANNANTVSRVKYVVEAQLKQMENISNQINFVNSNIRKYALLPHDPVKSYEITTELRKYSDTLPFIQEVALYYVGTEQVYTNKSVYDYHYLLGNNYRIQHLETELLYSELSYNNKWHTLYAENVHDGYRYLTFIHPFSRNGNNPDRVVLFFVKEDDFQHIFSNENVNIPGINLILDHDNQIITSFSDDDGEVSAALIAQIMDRTALQHDTVYDETGQAFLLIVEESGTTGWKFIRVIPEEKVRYSIAHVRNTLLYGLLIIIIVGSVLVYISMFMNYKPIGRLRRYTQSIWQDNREPLNELDVVRKAMDSIVLQNSKLNHEVQANQEAYRDHLLFSLLKGRIVSLEQFNESAERVGMRWSNLTFGVAIIQYSYDAVVELRKKEVLREIENLLPNVLEGYCREHFDEHKIVMILSLDESAADQVLPLLTSFRNQLTDVLGEGITIGVGEFSNQFYNIPRSYIEASYAVGYRFVMGNNRLIAISEVNESEQNNVYPTEMLARIGEAIQSGEQGAITLRLKQFIELIKRSGTTLYWARKLCYDTMNIISTAMKEYHAIDMVNLGYTFPDVFVLEKFETIEEFAEVMNDVCHDISKSLQQTDDVTKHIDDIVLMEQYIKQNYSDCDFSTQQMAEQFGMASSNLSQYFKSRTGKTIIQYVSELRMDKAKLLLGSGKLELRYIAEEVGYYNVSSFIRRFKQIVGVTPGEYRNR